MVKFVADLLRDLHHSVAHLIYVAICMPIDYFGIQICHDCVQRALSCGRELHLGQDEQLMSALS